MALVSYHPIGVAGTPGMWLEKVEGVSWRWAVGAP